MVNFRRRRPRKQPRSVMSSPDRIYKPAAEPLEEGVNTPPKPKKRKVFKIGRRYIGPIRFHFQTHEWQHYRSYATEKARDSALAALERPGPYKQNWLYRAEEKSEE